MLLVWIALGGVSALATIFVAGVLYVASQMDA